MENKIKYGLWAVVGLILATMLLSISSCSLIKPVSDFIFTASKPVIEQTPDAVLYSKLSWLSIASIIGIAIAAASAVNGQIKLAVPIFCGCVAALGISLAVVKYASFLAIGSLVAAICIFAYSILIKNRAVKELVMGAQELKGKIDPVNGSKVLFDTQSPSTRGMVNKIKDALKLKGKL